MGKIIIRNEKPEDYRRVENLVREAFWDLYKPGCDEHWILHRLRNVPAFVQALDFVACDGPEIVGNIVYSEAKVRDRQGREFVVLCLGPVAVLPMYQNAGIGSLIIKKSLDEARALGYKAVLLFGNPEYYRRFGFRNAREYGIQTAQGENLDPFMGLELYEGSLSGISGRFFYDPVFESGNDGLELFEREFPCREKHITATQLKA